MAPPVEVVAWVWKSLEVELAKACLPKSLAQLRKLGVEPVRAVQGQYIKLVPERVTENQVVGRVAHEVLQIEQPQAVAEKRLQEAPNQR